MGLGWLLGSSWQRKRDRDSEKKRQRKRETKAASTL